MQERSRLVVLADGGASPSDVADAWVLRLAGAAGDDECLPGDVDRCAAQARSQLRAEYPAWLRATGEATGARELGSVDGVDWWWLAEISEMSCLRSRLLTDLDALLLVRSLLDAHRAIERVEWHGSDSALAASARTVVNAAGRGWHREGGSSREKVNRVVMRRAAYAFVVLARAIAVRVPPMRSWFRRDTDADVVCFTRVPDMANGDDRWHDRALGDLDAVVENAGARVQWCASWFGRIRLFDTRGRRLGATLRRSVLTIVERELTFGELFASQRDAARIGLAFRRWRRRHTSAPAFLGIDVDELFTREVGASAFGTELPANIALMRAARRIAQGTQARIAVLSFEYQPVERAAAAGVHRGRAGVSVVGVQAGVYNANQLGWTFGGDGADTVEPRVLPDLVAAFGDIAADAFSSGLGRDAVVVCGGVRYDSTLRDERAERDTSEATTMLVATSSARGESLVLLEHAFAVAAGRDDIRVLCKFHPLQQLPDDLARLRRRYRVEHVEVHTAGLQDLLRRASLVVCGATSTGLEAIAAGCMPVVYNNPGVVSPNPMELVPDAVFFWRTGDELAAAIDACRARGPEFEARRAAWDAALAGHLFRLDGGAGARLRDELERRRLIGAAQDVR